MSATATRTECVDVYGYTFDCPFPADPCHPAGSTLYTVHACDPSDGTWDAFCTAYGDHPACADWAPTAVEVGTPPTPPVSLPATGPDTVVAPLAALLLLVGVLMVRLSRKEAQ